MPCSRADEDADHCRQRSPGCRSPVDSPQGACTGEVPVPGYGGPVDAPRPGPGGGATGTGPGTLRLTLRLASRRRPGPGPAQWHGLGELCEQLHALPKLRISGSPKEPIGPHKLCKSPQGCRGRPPTILRPQLSTDAKRKTHDYHGNARTCHRRRRCARLPAATCGTQAAAS